MPETITAESLAAHLDTAAERIETNGLHQRDLYDYRQRIATGTPAEACRLCASGAILLAVHGRPHFPTDRQRQHEDAWRRACAAVATHLALPGTQPWNIADFNDAPGRTAKEVTEALRATAIKLRSGELAVPASAFAL